MSYTATRAAARLAAAQAAEAGPAFIRRASVEPEVRRARGRPAREPHDGNPDGNPDDEDPGDGNPGGPGNPDDDPDREPDDGPGPGNDGIDNNDIIAQAIANAIRATRQNNERARAKEPERFSGSDPSKLRTFLVSCELVFRAQPGSYNTDDSRINYAMSYLSGTAQTWFEPFIFDPPDPLPDFLESWAQFKDELVSNFGEPDAQANAEFKIRRLRMADNHKCARYSVEFMSIAPQTQWDDRALAAAYYDGLPDRLKDRIMERLGGRPRNLNDMRRAAQDYDTLYWQRQEEKSRSRAAHTPENSRTTTTTRSSTTSTTSGSNSGRTDNTTAKTSTSKSGGSNKSGGRTNDLTGKLTNNNKLTNEERLRRISENLCLYCGKSGHRASDCRLAAANSKKATESKARSANTEPNPAPATTSEPTSGSTKSKK